MRNRETLEFIAATALKLAEMAQISQGRVLGYLLYMAAEAATEEAVRYGRDEKSKSRDPVEDPSST